MSSAVVAVGPVLPRPLAEALRHFLQCGETGPLVEELQRLMPVPLSGLLLYGSLAARPFPIDICSSDIDLLVLTDAPAHGGIFGLAEDLQLDLHVQARDVTLGDAANQWVYSGARVLWDFRPPQLQEWLQKLQSWKIAHPPCWDAADMLRNQQWAQRLIARIAKLQTYDMALARLQIARLLAVVPGWHAQLCGTHTSSFSGWWRTVERSDPTFHASLSQCLADPMLSITQLQSVFAQLFEAPQRMRVSRPTDDEHGKA